MRYHLCWAAGGLCDRDLCPKCETLRLSTHTAQGSCNEVFLFLFPPTLQFDLTPERAALIWMSLRIQERNWSPLGGILRAFAFVVFLQARGDVVSDTCVDRAVGTTDQINKPRFFRLAQGKSPYCARGTGGEAGIRTLERVAPLTA